MKQITSITNDTKQTVNFILDDGSRVIFSLNYVISQQGWFYSFSYGTVTWNNARLVNSPNMLRGIRNLIPFGLACVVVDGYEPIYQNDFSSGRVTLWLLNSVDVAQTETLITLTMPNFSGYPLD